MNLIDSEISAMSALEVGATMNVAMYYSNRDVRLEKTAVPKIGPCGRLAVAATPAAADQSFPRLDESMNKHSP